MSKAGKRRLELAAVLAAGLLVLVYLLSQGKYRNLRAQYRENTDVFAASAAQLRDMLAEVGKGEAWHHGKEPYIELRLRDGQAAPLTVGREEREPEDFPGLTEWVAALWEAGVSHIYVYDFTYSRYGESAFPCEIWYEAGDGVLVYSESGTLTCSYDVTMTDGPGYRFFQKWLAPNWFAGVSRYNRDNPYWRM